VHFMRGPYAKYWPYLAGIMAAGLLLVLTSGGLQRTTPVPAGGSEGTGDSPGPRASTPLLDDLQRREQHISVRLGELLREIEGAGRVAVTVMLESGPSSTYHEAQTASSSGTEEQDSSGGVRVVEESSRQRTLSLLRSAGGGESPLLIGSRSGEVRGVVVVAEGASDSRVKAALLRAVCTLLDVPPHRVAVLVAKGGI